MIDHITLHVSNAERSIAFYTKALSPLGYIPKAHHEPTIGFGVDDGTPRSDFYISPMDGPAAFVLDPDGNNIEAVTDWSHTSQS